MCRGDRRGLIRCLPGVGAALLLLLVGCAATTAPGGSTVSTSSAASLVPPTPGGGPYEMAQTSSPMSTAATVILGEGAHLRINQHQTACCYTEGQISYLVVRDRSGAVVAWRGFDSGVLAMDLRVKPASYQIESFQRPCDGNCSLLDPPTDFCKLKVVLKAGQDFRATVVFVPDRGCSIKPDPS